MNGGHPSTLDLHEFRPPAVVPPAPTILPSVKRPTWSVVRERLCDSYVAGSITIIVCTIVVNAEDYRHAGVWALWPLIAGWCIAGIPVGLAAPSGRGGRVALAWLAVCLALVFVV